MKTQLASTDTIRGLQAENSRLEAENKQLREALQETIDHANEAARIAKWAMGQLK